MPQLAVSVWQIASSASFWKAGLGCEAMVGCLQLSFEEGQTSQGHFTLTLQLKNDREACLYRPGVGQVCAYSLSDSARGLLGEYHPHAPCMPKEVSIITAGLLFLCHMRRHRARCMSTHAECLRRLPQSTTNAAFGHRKSKEVHCRFDMGRSQAENSTF